MKSKIININKLLVERFGIPKRNKKLPNPVDSLIATILSQNTNDKNSYRAFNNLKEKFKSWEEVSSTPRYKIEQAIKVAGLGKQKSNSIKNFLSGLKNKNGRISLSYIKKMRDDEVLSELTSYDGIGVKTASCVLLFAMDRNVCPVDTHVHRILNRTGLVKTKTPDKTFYAINKNMPQKIAHRFHTNLIRLGREVCKPAKPNCAACPVLKVCEYKSKNLTGKVKYNKNEFMLLDSIG